MTDEFSGFLVCTDLCISPKRWSISQEQENIFKKANTGLLRHGGNRCTEAKWFLILALNQRLCTAEYRPKWKFHLLVYSTVSRHRNAPHDLKYLTQLGIWVTYLDLLSYEYRRYDSLFATYHYTDCSKWIVCVTTKPDSLILKVLGKAVCKHRMREVCAQRACREWRSQLGKNRTDTAQAGTTRFRLHCQMSCPTSPISTLSKIFYICDLKILFKITVKNILGMSFLHNGYF